MRQKNRWISVGTKCSLYKKRNGKKNEGNKDTNAEEIRNEGKADSSEQDNMDYLLQELKRNEDKDIEMAMIRDHIK